MCLSVRSALTPPYAQVMQRQYHPCFRDRVLRVRIPPCVPFFPSGAAGQKPAAVRTCAARVRTEQDPFV